MLYAVQTWYSGPDFFQMCKQPNQLGGNIEPRQNLAHNLPDGDLRVLAGMVTKPLGAGTAHELL